MNELRGFIKGGSIVASPSQQSRLTANIREGGSGGGGGNYYTKAEVDNLIAPLAEEADISTVGFSGQYNDLLNKPEIPDLDNYYTKEETDSAIEEAIPENVSELVNDAGYITSSSLTPYASKEWVDAKGFLTEHQSLAGYATEEWVQDQDYVDSSALVGLATESYVDERVDDIEIPTKTSQLQNDSSFATSSYVDNAVERVEREIPSLTNYYTKTQTDTKISEAQPDLTPYAKKSELANVATSGSYNDLSNKPSIPSLTGYATEQWVEGKGYITNSALTNYATKTYVDEAVEDIEVPTKTSDLVNDSGFLTSHQSLAGYATETFVEREIENLNIPTKTSELTNDSGFLTQHQSLANYATKTYVDEAIEDIEVPTKTSDLVNDSGFLTQHQSLTDYAKKTYVDSAVSNISASGVSYNNVASGLSATKVQGAVDEVVGRVQALESQASSKLERIIVSVLPTTDIKTNAIYMVLKGEGSEGDIYDEFMYINNKWERIGSSQTDLSDYYTKSQTDAEITLALVPYAESADLATVATSGSYNDLTNKPTIPSLTGYATQTWVENKHYLTSSSLSGYATEDYVDDAIGDLVIPTKTSELTNDSGFLTQHQSLTNYATKVYVDNAIDAIDIPTKTSDLTNDSGFLTEHQSLSGYATQSWVEGKGYLTQHQSLSNYYTKAQTDSAISSAQPDLSPYAKTANLATVATSGSYNDLKNKPSIPSIAGLATETYVNNKVASITVPTKTSDLTNDSGFLTSHQSLANYYTKTEVNNRIPTLTSQLTNDSGYLVGTDATATTANQLNADLLNNQPASYYASTSWVESKGYATESYVDGKNFVPSGGSTNQVLTKTSSGYAWANNITVPVSSVNGKTGAVNLGFKSIIISTSDPSGGENGDIWIKYE